MFLDHIQVLNFLESWGFFIDIQLVSMVVCILTFRVKGLKLTPLFDTTVGLPYLAIPKNLLIFEVLHF